MRWGGIFDIDAKLIEIINEEEKTFAPDFWNNAKEAELLIKNLRQKKKWVEDFEKGNELAEELQITYDFFKEGDVFEEELDTLYVLTNSHIEDLEFRNMLSEEGDNMSAVLQITAGAGGTESLDWASKLMGMEMKRAEKQKY